MTNIRTLLSQVESRLCDALPEAGFIGRNRGQLLRNEPAVAWPCILLDIEAVDYTQSGRGTQMADARITVTVAAPTIPTAAAAPTAGDGILELLERIHTTLHRFTDGYCTPLCRTTLRRGSIDTAKESYEMTYSTTFGVDGDTDDTTVAVQSVDLHLR